MTTPPSPEELRQSMLDLRSELNLAIFGQEELITETIVAFLSHGHILMTGAPGLAKTTLVKAFASKLGLAFGRVQFTPDLLPSDITGGEILNIDPQTQRRSFEFTKGPIFVNLLLADEINRASPRTQSAMLESMQEGSVTTGWQQHDLPQPFMVFATQNPYESEGTFPLPEAQLDRFLIHSVVSYPDSEAELKIITDHASNQLIGESKIKSPSQVIEIESIQTLFQAVQKTSVPPEILEVINTLVRMTRPDDESFLSSYANSILYGAGPRAGIGLVSACRALAFLEGTEEVRFSHVKRMAPPALRHRVKLSIGAYSDQITADIFVQDILTTIEAKHGSR